MPDIPPPPPGFHPAPESSIPPPPPGFRPITPGDFVTGKGEAARIGTAAAEGTKRLGRALSTPEQVLRTVPPVAMQAAGAIGGGYVGGEAGAAAGGAAASVLTDYYDRFLNRMYGVPNAPVSLGHETASAVLGGLTAEAPAGAEAITGLRGARKIATEAAAKAGTEQTEVMGKIAQRQAEAGETLTAAKSSAAAALTAKKSDVAEDVLAKSAKATQDIQKVIDDQKAKLSQFKAGELEKARQQAVPQIATKQIQGMTGKNAQQLAKQEAMQNGPEFARVRAASMGPVFEGAQQYHEETGNLFEPYIGKHASEELKPDDIAKIASKIDGIKQIASERGQNISDPELNKIFDRIELAGEKPVVSFGKRTAASNDEVAKLQARLEAEAAAGPTKPLTVGEAWGLRSRLGKVLAKSNNPAVRLAAHEAMEPITDAMPEVPAEVRQQYATQRSLFPPKLMREVAGARNPAEIGAAIFGTPTTPEPAQVALNLIRRAKTPEAQEGLRTAFADNWLNKPHNPEDINRFNPEVIKSLYGKNADAVFKLLGPEGNFKSASWTKLLATDMTDTPRSVPRASLATQATHGIYTDDPASTLDQIRKQGMRAGWFSRPEVSSIEDRLEEVARGQHILLVDQSNVPSGFHTAESDYLMPKWGATQTDPILGPSEFGNRPPASGRAIPPIKILQLVGPDPNNPNNVIVRNLTTTSTARVAFDQAYQGTIRSETGKALQEAISKGEQALRDQPSKFAQYQAALKDIKTPEDKLKTLEAAFQQAGQPTEKEAATLARTPQQGAVEALGKRGFAPDSRLERMALAGLAFRAYFSLAGAGGAIAKHPELAIGAGVLLGGRGVIRSALSSPAIAEQYVKMLGIGATKSNAPIIAKTLAQITAASALQYVKDGSQDASSP